MSDFDDAMAPIQENQGNTAQNVTLDRMAIMENFMNEMHNRNLQLEAKLQNLQIRPPPLSTPSSDLDIAHPPIFTGQASELPHFKFRLRLYFTGNRAKYDTAEKQLLYVSGQLDVESRKLQCMRIRI